MLRAEGPPGGFDQNRVWPLAPAPSPLWAGSQPAAPEARTQKKGAFRSAKSAGQRSGQRSGQNVFRSSAPTNPVHTFERPEQLEEFLSALPLHGGGPERWLSDTAGGGTGSPWWRLEESGRRRELGRMLVLEWGSAAPVWVSPARDWKMNRRLVGPEPLTSYCTRSLNQVSALRFRTS